MDLWTLMFWACVVGLVALAGLVLWRWSSRPLVVDPGASDMAVYRDQLDEVARDLARGVVTQDEAEGLRTEIARRLLKADARADVPLAAARHSWVLAIAVVATLAGAIGFYAQRGAVGYADMPLSARIAAADDLRRSRDSQAVAEGKAASNLPSIAPDPQYAALVAELRSVLQSRPDDERGHRLLAVAEARVGNLPAAHAAQSRVVALAAERATAEDWATLAELQIAAADGYVSPEAEQALRETLTLDPGHAPARYAVAALHIQTGRPDLAFPIWADLLEQGPPGAPWMAPIRGQIEALAVDAGALNYEPPVPLRGPTAEDIANTEGMSQEDQLAMARGMVSRLSDRLATQGGSLPEWMQLIQSLGALGETDQATAIYTEALQIFGGDPTAASRLTQLGARLGLSQ